MGHVTGLRSICLPIAGILVKIKVIKSKTKLTLGRMRGPPKIKIGNITSFDQYVGHVLFMVRSKRRKPLCLHLYDKSSLVH